MPRSAAASALRGCVLNYRTTLRDMEMLLDDLRRVAGEDVKKSQSNCLIICASGAERNETVSKQELEG